MNRARYTRVMKDAMLDAEDFQPMMDGTPLFDAFAAFVNVAVGRARFARHTTRRVRAVRRRRISS